MISSVECQQQCAYFEIFTDKLQTSTITSLVLTKIIWIWNNQTLKKSSGWGNNGKWVCRRCSCECGESLVELKVEDRYRCKQDRVSKALAADGDIWICWNPHCDIVYDRRFLSYRGRCQRTGCKGILDPDGKCDFCTCRYCRKPLDRDSENPTLWKCNNNCTYKVETDIEKGFVKGVVRYITESR